MTDEKGNHGLVLAAIRIGRGLLFLDGTARSRKKLPAVRASPVAGAEPPFVRDRLRVDRVSPRIPSRNPAHVARAADRGPGGW